MDRKPTRFPHGAFIGIGLALGTAIGASLHNVGLGVAFGLLGGTVVMAIAAKGRR